MKKSFFLLLIFFGLVSKAVSQNVGIGTNEPEEKLSVVSIEGYGISHQWDSIKLSTYIDSSGGYFGTKTDHPFHLYTNNGAAQVSLLQNGNLGIGTIEPLEKLSVLTTEGYGISHQRDSIRLSTYIDGSGGYFGTFTDHPFHLYTNNGAAQVSLLQNGYLGIGNINPQYKLDVAGRIRLRTGAVGNSYTSSGIWMDDYSNGNARIFLGMQDTIRLGIWGEGVPGVGWGFNFNARNGNVGIGVMSPVNKLEVAGHVLSTGNITGNSFQYNTPQTFYYSIPPAAFTSTYYSDGGEFAWHIYVEDDEATIYSDYHNRFVAPVHLPDGATVTELKVYGIDTYSFQDEIFALCRRSHEVDTYDTMCTVQSSGNQGDFEAAGTSISFPVISNQYYNYTVHVFAWASVHRIRSVRIKYTMTKAQ